MAGPANSIQDSVSELWQLLVAYARQETIGPLKALGHQLKWGIPGALCMALGCFLLGLAVLRMLQVYGFFGAHDWLNYVVAAGFVVIVIAALVARMRAGLARARTPAAEPAT